MSEKLSADLIKQITALREHGGDIAEIQADTLTPWVTQIRDLERDLAAANERETVRRKQDAELSYCRIALGLDDEQEDISGEIQRQLNVLSKQAEKARRAGQILIEEIGAPGPESVVDTAERAVAELKALRARVEAYEALACDIMKALGIYPGVESQIIPAIDELQRLKNQWRDLTQEEQDEFNERFNITQWRTPPQTEPKR